MPAWSPGGFRRVHEEFRVEPHAMEILPRLVWHYDEPFADASAVPTWYVAQLTRQHVTVALTGDGGDELFAGYPRYLAVWLAERFDRLPALVRRLAAGRFWQRLPASSRQKSLLRRWKRFVEVLGQSPRRALPRLDRHLQRGPPGGTLQRRLPGLAARRRSAAVSRRRLRP